jgi:[calcium/calmodulin-dependent protein kinase] kinase
MFSKDEPNMTTAKSAGSPAFMPPELCVVRHGEVSGRAADIWSMGVTLYSLAFGHIPFENTGMLELFEAIKNEDVSIPGDCDPGLADLLRQLLEKDPAKRIKMDDIRVR